MRDVLPSPDLGDDAVLRVVCGLRPCRHGGLRIEQERLGAKHIVHNYGQGGCGVTIGFGCAVAAANEVAQLAEPQERIGVLGGGVVGLTTADELLRRGYRVRIYAAAVATETTSNLAGALWLPTGVERGRTDWERARFERILAISRERFLTLDRSRLGVVELPVYEPEEAELHTEYFGVGSIAEPEPLDRLPFAGEHGAGRVYRTDLIHTPRFLRTVLADIRHRGAEIERAVFTALDDIRRVEQRVLVNCLALSSRTLFADAAVYPAYGLLVHMRAQEIGYIVHDGYQYLFPREDALVLGGCFRAGVESDTPDPALASEIIRHHRWFFGLP